MHYFLEALDYKKRALGVVKFSTSGISDPFSQKIIKLLSGGDPNIEQNIINEIMQVEQKASENEKLAPILFATSRLNICENELFTLLCVSDVKVPGAPQFSNVTMQRLLRNIEGNHHEMFPLKSFIDDRALPVQKIDYVHHKPDFKNDRKNITTAAATPNGTFIFNVPFMQRLLDWGYLKGIKSPRPIYKSHDGTAVNTKSFPDEWSYIEFLIMHEYMHYTNDDFYYQHTIHNANNKIINWVGDFRSNYQLVKSGYSQLPIGLYNDKINYDRQTNYIDMYNIIKSEMDKLPKDKQDQVSDAADGMANDNHEPGQEEGASSDNTEKVDKKQDGKDINSKMDEHAKEQAEKVQEGSNRDSKDNAQKQPEPSGESGTGDQAGGENSAVDTTKIKTVEPTFSWKEILRRCVPTDVVKTEEHYGKIRKNAIASLEIVRQTGAGYVAPAETELPADDLMVGFVLDTSGSMAKVVPTIMANAIQLLKDPVFANSIVTVVKFASSMEITKVDIGKKKSAIVQNVSETPKQWPNPANDAFTFTFSGGTHFNGPIVTQTEQLLTMGYNIIICSDTDILDGENLKSLISVIKKAPKQVFIIFDKHTSYVKARSIGVTTGNTSYFGK